MDAWQKLGGRFFVAMVIALIVLSFLIRWFVDIDEVPGGPASLQTNLISAWVWLSAIVIAAVDCALAEKRLNKNGANGAEDGDDADEPAS